MPLNNATRLRHDLQAISISDDSTLIAGEFERYIVHGLSAGALDPNLDLGKIDERLAAALTTQRLLVHEETGEAELSRGQAAHWEALGIHATDACNRLRQSSVQVLGNQSFTREISKLLRKSLVNIDEKAQLRIVSVADYLDTGLAAINDEALGSRQPWTIAKPRGREVWIGPIFQPGMSACWACLRHRLVQNRWTDSAVWRANVSMPAVSIAHMPSHASLAASLLSAEVLRFLATGESNLHSCLMTVDTVTWQVRKHPVERRAECPRCRRLGRPLLWAKPAESQMNLADIRRRTESAITGFLHDFTDYGGQWHPFRISTAVVVPPLNARATFAHRSPLRVSGVGLTPEQAERSCIGEALERYSLFARGSEPCVTATVADMAERGVQPEALWQFSENQYEDASEWNALKTPECGVPERLWHKHPIEWLEGRNYTGGRCTYLPAGFVLLAYSHYDASFCIADSTGAAAGASTGDAILGGLLEIIERDAAAVWWYNRLLRPAFDCGCEESLRAWSTWFAERDRTLHILDLTTDWQVPVAAAVSARRDGSQVLYATAAAVENITAATRAVSEVVQMLFASAMHAGTMKAAWLESQTLALNPYLSPCSRPPQPNTPVRPKDLPSLLELATTLGFEVIAVDLTRSGIGVPVYRVCVPGMRSAARRLAPGRLYDLPLKMQWQSVANTEEMLNPWPFLL